MDSRVRESESALHKNQETLHAGLKLEDAAAAMILIHGRGSSAREILTLAEPLHHPEFAYLAPQATDNTWYPYTFLAPIAQNEPGLSSGLQVIGNLIERIEAAGISGDKIVLGGFSQGACLAAEYVARHPREYGGLLVFSGGVIGPLGMERSDEGDLEGTPVFVGCSDVDQHIPLERVQETAEVMRTLNGEVESIIYPGMGHTIVQDELDWALRLVNSVMDDSR